MENQNYNNIPSNTIITTGNVNKKKKLKKWLIVSVIAIVLLVLYIGYTFLLGGGRFIGTWTQKGINKKEYILKSFGSGEYKFGEKLTFPINWEYDDSTKCLIIEIEAEQNPWIEVYKVEYIDENMMQLTQCNERNGDYIEFYKVK